jgi:hypothetical protein
MPINPPHAYLCKGFELVRQRAFLAYKCDENLVTKSFQLGSPSKQINCSLNPVFDTWHAFDVWVCQFSFVRYGFQLLSLGLYDLRHAKKTPHLKPGPGQIATHWGESSYGCIVSYTRMSGSFANVHQWKALPILWLVYTYCYWNLSISVKISMFTYIHVCW